MSRNEQCLLCAHFSHEKGWCLRVVKFQLVIGRGGGSLDIETQPGVVPEYLEDELTQALSHAIPRIVDAWPGWREIEDWRQKDQGRAECAAREERPDLKDYTNVVPLYKNQM